MDLQSLDLIPNNEHKAITKFYRVSLQQKIHPEWGAEYLYIYKNQAPEGEFMNRRTTQHVVELKWTWTELNLGRNFQHTNRSLQKPPTKILSASFIMCELQGRWGGGWGHHTPHAIVRLLKNGCVTKINQNHLHVLVIGYTWYGIVYFNIIIPKWGGVHTIPPIATFICQHDHFTLTSLFLWINSISPLKPKFKLKPCGRGSYDYLDHMPSHPHQ